MAEKGLVWSIDQLQRWQTVYSAWLFIKPWLLPVGTSVVPTFLVMREHVHTWQVFLVALYGLAGGLLLVFALSKAKPNQQATNESSFVMRPIRVLERHYMALVSLHDHVEDLKNMETLTGRPKSLIDSGLALEKIRKEIIDLSPSVFPTSLAIDLQRPPIPDGIAGLSDNVVPVHIEELLKKLHRHWRIYSEQAGVSPLKFKANPIVKLRDD